MLLHFDSNVRNHFVKMGEILKYKLDWYMYDTNHRPCIDQVLTPSGITHLWCCKI